MKTIIPLFFSILLFFSCSKEERCSEAEMRSAGVIHSITGPDTLSLGKTVALVVEVAANDSFCSKRAEGYIVEAGATYLQIGADLIHVAAGRENCGCVTTPTIKTLIYFTPNKGGYYTFGSGQEDISSGSPPGDTSNYQVFVR